MLEIFFQSTWKIESSKSISELHTDDQKSKYSRNPEDLFKSDKKKKNLQNEDNLQSYYY